MALEASAMGDIGCCLCAICAFIGLFVGPCLIWLVHDNPNPYYAVQGTLLNHSECVNMPLWTDGWFALNVAMSGNNTDSVFESASGGTSVVVVRAQYVSTLCTASRWQVPDCCDKLVGVTNAFWLQVLRDDGRAFNPSLSQPYLPADSQSFWRIVGCIVFAAALLVGCIQLVMLARHIVSVRHEQRTRYEQKWLAKESGRLAEQN